MYKIEEETYKWAYKPLDIVSDKDGNVGMIREVSVNSCQEDPNWQISYAISWLTGSVNKVAWFDHKELTQHCNIMIKLAECAAGHHNDRQVKTLFKHM